MKTRLFGILWSTFIVFQCATVTAQDDHQVHLGAGFFNERPYVSDGTTLHRVSADPSKLHPDEWQIWLYRRDPSTALQGFFPRATRSPADRWGQISGKTSDDVKRKLKDAQTFEVDYCHFIGKPDDCEQNMTYFNPLGPIAITYPQPVRYLPRIIEIEEQVRDLKEKFKQLMDLRATLEQQFSSAPYTKENVRNPFAGAGKLVLEYGKQLEHSVKAVKDLDGTLAQLTDRSSVNLGELLDQIGLKVQNEELQESKYALEITRIYQKAIEEGRGKKTNAAPVAASIEKRAPWMHTEYDDGGTRNVTPFSGGVVVETVTKQDNDNGTETEKTTLVFKEIRSVQPKTTSISSINSDGDGHIGSTINQNWGVRVVTSTASYIFWFDDEQSAKDCEAFFNQNKS